MVVFCSKQLRTKYILFLALSFGDWTNGLSFILAGIYRYVYMRQGNYFVATTSLECFGTPWALLMIFAGQFPALINLFIALERIVAIQCASFYRRVWKNSHKWYLVILAAFLTSVFMIAGVIINLIHVRKNPTRLCSTMQTTGAAYGTIHYTLIAILYLSCFIALNIIFYRINKTRVPPKAELRKQKMSLAIVGASVVLASIPLLVVTLNEWETPKIDGVIVGEFFKIIRFENRDKLQSVGE
ncbi:hypothetical protein ANCCAN_13247 [Ancylostoma caninum]|uniref:G-protein coupled receptors family 1 profile domain-containing protein n=1 Tax=Ancylostoma caninum TaxID=29170 RepID=A0A368G8Y7_ANCCA|nr:hypothetical protein ANCCAN_13247 [Ancylostoma caninum]